MGDRGFMLSTQHSALRTAAIVPVKGLGDAKGRLRDVLSPPEREDLTLWMLERVLRAFAEPQMVSRVCVVTPDARVAKHAEERGAVALRERGRGGLNVALEEARREARIHGAEACLVALGDLPLLQAGEVVGMLACGEDTGACVAAPDRHGRGTNALLVRPLDTLPLLFGSESYGRHLEAARSRRVRLETYHSSGTGLDVDTADDLRELLERAGAMGLELPVGLAELACVE